jgi:hypothetical protein
MKSFYEMLRILESEEKHPEILDESMLGNLGRAAVVGAALWAGSGAEAAERERNVAASSAQDSRSVDQIRMDAMQRISDGSDYKRNWMLTPEKERSLTDDEKKNHGITAAQEKMLIQSFLKMKTAKDHEDLIKLIKQDMNEIIRVQTAGSSAVTPEERKQHRESIMKSQDYQYKRWLLQLVYEDERVQQKLGVKGF